jgi:hypothetical protein
MLVTKDKLDVKVHDGNLYIEAEEVVPTPVGLRLQHADVFATRTLGDNAVQGAVQHVGNAVTLEVNDR